ncbi:MAG: acyl-CoA desaturase [Gemmataceae bacterium]
MQENESPAASSDNELQTVKAPLTMRLATLFVIVVPFLGLLAAPFFFLGWGFRWTDLGLLMGFYLVSAVGITVGFHRLFTHRSFETYAPIKFLLGVMGSMAIQGPMLKWVAMHRRHHQHSDTPEDPHSPYHHGSGILGLIRGAWHSHIGWFFQRDPENLARYVPDLRASKILRAVSALFPLWALLGVLFPAVLGGLITHSWTGAITGLLWGGIIRVFLVHHVTWSVNSACHLWGHRTFPVNDHSRDNLLFGILALGEGWHNSHHAFPTSARHGLRWWQIDLSYLMIRALAWLGLAWDVQLPPKRLQVRALAIPSTR